MTLQDNFLTSTIFRPMDWVSSFDAVSLFSSGEPTGSAGSADLLIESDELECLWDQEERIFPCQPELSCSDECGHFEMTAIDVRRNQIIAPAVTIYDSLLQEFEDSMEYGNGAFSLMKTTLISIARILDLKPRRQELRPKDKMKLRLEAERDAIRERLKNSEDLKRSIQTCILRQAYQVPDSGQILRVKNGRNVGPRKQIPSW
jgi:hypothetical protein